jgi:hypothetical protein
MWGRAARSPRASSESRQPKPPNALNPRGGRGWQGAAERDRGELHQRPPHPPALRSSIQRSRAPSFQTAGRRLMHLASSFPPQLASSQLTRRLFAEIIARVARVALDVIQGTCPGVYRQSMKGLSAGVSLMRSKSSREPQPSQSEPCPHTQRRPCHVSRRAESD